MWTQWTSKVSQTVQQFGRTKEKGSILKMVMRVGLIFYIFLPKAAASINYPQPESTSDRTVAIVMGVTGSILALGTLTTLIFVCVVGNKKKENHLFL